MINEIRKEIPSTLLMLLILLCGAWYFFADSMSTYPAYIHAWTQSDRLALAMNFQENGFDFFHPATYSLLTKNGITQVDFPIHDYLVACISSFLKVEIIPVFRSYNLAFSLLGLFFFFRLSLILVKSPIRSVAVTTFLFTLPFYVYYQNGFLPSAPSFACFLVGIYFLIRARIQQSKINYIAGVLLLTLAALARAPFFIFLFALFLQQLWQQFKQKELSLLKTGFPLFGIALFVAYFLYNKHLGATFGSMFLSEFLHFQSFSQFIEIISSAADRWGKQLLSPFHLVLLMVLLLSGIIQYNKKGFSTKNTASLFHYFLIASVGVLFYFFLFGRQFADHDYYYIDTFLPLLSLLLILLLARIEIPKKWYATVGTVVGIFFIYFFTYAKNIQESRYTPAYNDRIEYAYSIYEKSKGELRKWGVKKEDTLYVLEANSTNMPFTVWENKGYTGLNSSAAIVSRELDSAFTYAVLLDSFFVMDAFDAYPNLINRLERVNGNGEISVYKKSKSNQPNDFFENLIYYGYTDFDNNDNVTDSITAWTSEESVTDSMGKSLNIQPINEFTLSFKLDLKKVIPEKPIRAHLIADFLQEDSTNFHIVGSINNYYHTHYVISHFEEVNDWMHHQFDFKINPKFFKQGDRLSVYFWNPKKEKLFVDNFRLLIYQ